MFNSNSLISLPSGMTLASLTNGANMFASNNLTSLPNGMELRSLFNGGRMFQGIAGQNVITSAKLRLDSLQQTSSYTLNFMNRANINDSDYSDILIYLDSVYLTPGTYSINFGVSKYNSSAVAARASLVSKGWTIIDGGLI